MIRLAGALALLLVVVAAAACVPVRPHQREHLAHPAMQAPVWTSVEQADQHAFAIREGTDGARGAGGGGCGCN